MVKASTDSFSQARQEKRLIFQQHWNAFIRSPLLLSALIFFSAAQGLFLIFSGDFILALALNTGILRPAHPFWCDIVVFALQLLVSAPGCIIGIGLWMTYRRTCWQADTTPNITGLRWIRRVNLAVCILCGGALALYPTIIINAGEYLKEEAILQIFYLILGLTALLIVGVTLIRTVLRNAEENITCCWANTRFVLPLILVMAAVVIAVMAFAPLTQPFYICLGLLGLSYGYLLTVYWLFLKKVAVKQEVIDRKAIASHENPDDPYNRY